MTEPNKSLIDGVFAKKCAIVRQAKNLFLTNNNIFCIPGSG